MLEHDRDEEVCIKWDDLADEDFSHYMTESEYFRYKQNRWISHNKSGNDTQPVVLHQEAGGQQLVPILYLKFKERRPASSSSSSWWQWRILVVFIRIQRKSIKEDACKEL